MLQYSINGHEIPLSSIIGQPRFRERITFNNQKLMGSSLKIILDNSDRTLYDPLIPGSLFFESTGYGFEVIIYDSDIGRVIWHAVVSSVSRNDKKKTIEVETKNIIQQLADKSCVHSMSSDEPADVCYDILINAANIPTENVDKASFLAAATIQSSNGMYITTSIAEEDNKTVIQILSEICRMSQMHIYASNNKIFAWQYQEYGGDVGFIIEEHHVVEGSYSDNFRDTYYNEYSVAYNNGGSIAFATGSDSESSYDTSIFAVPDQSRDAGDDISELTIYFTTETGADSAGELAIGRFSDFVLECEFRIDISMDVIRLNDVISINFNDYQCEPIRVMEREVDRGKGSMYIKGVFLNYPTRVVPVTYEQPDAIFIQAVMPIDYGGLIVKFSKSIEDDIYKYRLFFSTTTGEWRSEWCHLGRSYLEVSDTDMTLDGFSYVKLYRLNQRVMYYFKMCILNNGYIKSEFSNTVHGTAVSDSSNVYRLDGDVVTEGLSLDEDNSRGGSPLDGYSEFGSSVYGEDAYAPCSFYQSPVYYSNNGFTMISWWATGDHGDVMFVYRLSDDGTMWSEWGSIDAVQKRGVDFASSKYIQFIVFFNSSYWTDDDMFFLRQVA